MEAWGKNSVIPISNWTTLQLKSLIKDISKFYGVEFGEVNNKYLLKSFEGEDNDKGRREFYPTEEVFDNIKNNISNNETKQTHSKDEILKKDKLNSLGDNILEKHKKI